MADATGVIYNLSRAVSCSAWRPPWRGPRTPSWHDFIEKSEADLGMFSMFGRTGKGKGKVFPYSLPSVGPGADPGVQAVSPQVT